MLLVDDVDRDFFRFSVLPLFHRLKNLNRSLYSVCNYVHVIMACVTE